MISDQEIESHWRYLKAVCYRMVGDASEAEDLVQEVFRRAIERPPMDTGRPWRPWLSRVAVHLSIDALRRRQRQVYDGPWLPTPVEGEGGGWLWAAGDDDCGEAKYSRMESASLAFLHAIEVLTAEQRAVLILRDVLGMSGAETAQHLGLTEVHVRVLHHRAKARLQGYDSTRPKDVGISAKAEVAALLGRMLQAIGAGDIEGVARLMSEEVKMYQDGGGVVKAARNVVVGAAQVARFFVKLSTKEGLPGVREVKLVEANGWPALLVSFDGAEGGRYATRSFLQPWLDPNGRVQVMFGVVAPEKLGWV